MKEIQNSYNYDSIKILNEDAEIENLVEVDLDENKN